jgi:hypothetical protein
MAKITKSQLSQLIKEEVVRIQKIKSLEAQKSKLDKELKALNESEYEEETMKEEAVPGVQGPLFDPSMTQSLSEAVDPGMMEAITHALSWLQGTAHTQVGNVPNWTLLSAPALAAVAGAITAAQSIKNKMMPKAPSAAPQKKAVNPASVDPGLRR